MKINRRNFLRGMFATGGTVVTKPRDFFEKMLSVWQPNEIQPTEAPSAPPVADWQNTVQTLQDLPGLRGPWDSESLDKAWLTGQGPYIERVPHEYDLFRTIDEPQVFVKADGDWELIHDGPIDVKGAEPWPPYDQSLRCPCVLSPRIEKKADPKRITYQDLCGLYCIPDGIHFQCPFCGHEFKTRWFACPHCEEGIPTEGWEVIDMKRDRAPLESNLYTIRLCLVSFSDMPPVPVDPSKCLRWERGIGCWWAWARADWEHEWVDSATLWKNKKTGKSCKPPYFVLDHDLVEVHLQEHPDWVTPTLWQCAVCESTTCPFCGSELSKQKDPIYCPHCKQQSLYNIVKWA